MPSLDRFEVGLPDRQAEEPSQVTECAFDRCRSPIYAGEKNWDFDRDWFCSAACIARHLGAEKRYVE
ncbi:MULTISPECIES: hypothetical protein [Paenibacillus]|uniref:hypothetical protein n=1 Tax=Paenibacillus TaxID=44249 RepID=UPI00020D7663|nr:MULTISPECIES: hypothetical protein [Paenibacillus]EGL13284.1 hypothetical protein HMPREF9413_1628 [Paenibacillus sp. HGF7]EPD82763.1 hypothetical protein HMPREF1207_03555 [Paenibacillus sp. HGH0039]MBV6713703.1 hypothetical protein [Paenibacillus chitinolyticus]